MTYAEIVILAMLMRQKRHGYELKRNAERIFGDNYTINNNTLYSCLHYFEKMGAVESEVQSVAGKPDRHVYGITTKGKEIFKDIILDFSHDTAMDDIEFYARVAFFHLLEPEERLKILEVRKSVLLERVKRFEDFSRPEKPSNNQDYDKSVAGFLVGQTKAEAGWIDSLESAIKNEMTT